MLQLIFCHWLLVSIDQNLNVFLFICTHTHTHTHAHTHTHTHTHTHLTVAPDDYDILSNFSLEPFDNRVRQLSFNLSVVDDNIPEEFEMFNVSLTLNPVDQDRSINSADQARIGDVVTLSSDLATITIQDNDGKPSIV